MPQQPDTYIVVATDGRYVMVNRYTGGAVRTYRSRDIAIDDARFLNRYCVPREPELIEQGPPKIAAGRPAPTQVR
jgi:hypothetical protein